MAPRRSIASRKDGPSFGTQLAIHDRQLNQARVTVKRFRWWRVLALDSSVPMADSHPPVCFRSLQLPLDNDSGYRPMFYKIAHPYFCWICGNVVNLETCKADEDGRAVHEDCYITRITLAYESVRLSELPLRSADSALMFPRILVRRLR